MKRFQPRILFVLLSLLATAASVDAQTAVLTRQRYFEQTVPPGNYSGLTHLDDNRYAVVNDKASHDGFSIMRIDVDSLSGEILSVRQDTTISANGENVLPQRDAEGICFFPDSSTLFISGEADNRILEYRLDGRLTGRRLLVPDSIRIPRSNYGFESLTYNAVTHRFWTTTESTLPQDGAQANSSNGIRNRLRLMAFDDSRRLCQSLTYLMDAPASRKRAAIYAMGVSELCALDDGRLLVLERELSVPKGKIGAYVINKIYSVNTSDTQTPVRKELVVRWKTNISLARQNFANYEGMCLGPRLRDGRQVIILCADSQNQYGGILRDWFRTLVIK